MELIFHGQLSNSEPITSMADLKQQQNDSYGSCKRFKKRFVKQTLTNEKVFNDIIWQIDAVQHTSFESE